jgi:alpha-glucosidase
VTGDVLELHRGDLRVLLNCGTTAVPLPQGRVLASSRSVTDVLPPDTCVWLG